MSQQSKQVSDQLTKQVAQMLQDEATVIQANNAKSAQSSVQMANRLEELAKQLSKPVVLGNATPVNTK
jgi:hypothetical protein